MRNQYHLSTCNYDIYLSKRTVSLAAVPGVMKTLMHMYQNTLIYLTRRLIHYSESISLVCGQLTTCTRPFGI